MHQLRMLLIRTGKCAVVQAVFCCLESCIKSAKISILAADFFTAIWEGAESVFPLGKMQDFHLKLFIWQDFIFIRKDPFVVKTVGIRSVGGSSYFSFLSSVLEM